MIQARLQINGEIRGREQITGNINGSVKNIYPELENLEINPTTQKQYLKSEKYGYNEITVNEVTSDIDKNIKSEHIKKGVTILGVDGGFLGIDTSDATATSDTIIEGKTAYANGQKIQGTMPNNGQLIYTPTLENQVIPKGYTDGGIISKIESKELNVKPSIEKQTFEGVYTTVNVDEIQGEEANITPSAETQTKEGVFTSVTIVGDENLIPENIKRGVSIFDVNGNAKVVDTKITNANYLFYNNARVESMKDILTLCENLTTMEYGFNGTELESMELSDLNVNDVVSMKYAFALNKNLTRLDLSKWNAKKVINLEGMFANSTNIKDLDISGIDASNVNTIGSFIFNNTKLTNFKSFKNLGKGYVTQTSNLYAYKLDLTKATLLTHDSLMDVINNLYDLHLTYNVSNGGILYTQDLVIGSTNLEKLTSDEIAIATNKGWNIW